MRKIIYPIVLLLSSWLLISCNSGKNHATIVDISPYGVDKKVPHHIRSYTVTEGDNLYSIAWAYSMDYRKLALFNQLTPPYALHTGQRLYLEPPPHARLANPTVTAKQSVIYLSSPYHFKQNQASPKRYDANTHHYWQNQQTISRWFMPANGHVINNFSKKLGASKGISISGQYGETVRAAASGTVVYSGNKLRGYGNLILIKHNNSYLSAYAFNQRNMVTVGQRVNAGQAIARMGYDNAGQSALYFEIRKNGTPVNPMQYLSR